MYLTALVSIYQWYRIFPSDYQQHSTANSRQLASIEEVSDRSLHNTIHLDRIDPIEIFLCEDSSILWKDKKSLKKIDLLPKTGNNKISRTDQKSKAGKKGGIHN
jgi:hypothetical protein